MDPIFETYRNINEASKPSKPEDWAVDAEKNKITKRDIHPSALKDGEHSTMLSNKYSDRVDYIKKLIKKYKYKIIRVGSFIDQGEKKYAMIYTTDGNA